MSRALAALVAAVGPLAFAAPAAAADQTISGTVTDSAANPVSGFCVTATRYSGSGSTVLVPARTAADGSYAISGPGVAPGDYTLQFAICQNGPAGPVSNYDLIPEYWDDRPDLSSADHFAVGEGESVTGKDATVQIGARVSGTISGPGGPMTGCVSLYGPGVAAGTQTGPSGDYTYRRLPPGEYKLRFSGCADPPQLAAEWYDDKPTGSQATPITLDAAEVMSGVDATLSPGGTIAGTVTGPGGTAVEGVCVTVFDGDGQQAAKVHTDASGRYSAGGLFAAPHRVRYEDCNHRANVASEYFEDAGSLAAADPIAVTEGGIAQANAQLGRGGSISGVVRGPDQLPLADACVTVYDRLGSSIAYAQTGVGGSYLIGSLETGTYRVRFDTCGAVSGDDIAEFWRDRAMLGGADPIAVAAGSDHGGIDATLGAADPVAPDTTITAGPAAGSRLIVAKATFGFESTIAASTFECRLDAGPWRPCAPPRSLSGLADGAHSFRVRATSPALLTDPTPATRTFTVAVGPCKQARAGLAAAEDRLAAAAHMVRRAKRRLARAKHGGNPGKVRRARRKLSKAQRAKRSAHRAVAAGEDSVARSCGSR